MTRAILMSTLCSVLVCGILSAEDDHNGEKLKAAKDTYTKSLERARVELVANLKKKAETAQKAGDLKTLEKVEEEIKALEEKEVLPKLVPTTGYVREVKAARAKLLVAYDAAVKSYTMEGKRALAKTIQGEWDSFKNTDVPNEMNRPADGFEAGIKLTGKYAFGFISSNGNKTSGVADWEMEVTKRVGKDFAAEIWADKRISGYVVEGTIEKGQVKYTWAKALTEDIPNNHIGNVIFSGRFENGQLTGVVTTPKINATLRGEVKLKVIKD